MHFIKKATYKLQLHVGYMNTIIALLQQDMSCNTNKRKITKGSNMRWALTLTSNLDWLQGNQPVLGIGHTQ